MLYVMGAGFVHRYADLTPWKEWTINEKYKYINCRGWGTGNPVD